MIDNSFCSEIVSLDTAGSITELSVHTNISGAFGLTHHNNLDIIVNFFLEHSTNDTINDEHSNNPLCIHLTFILYTNWWSNEFQKEKAAQEETEDVDPDMAAMMGFGGFKSSKK